MTETQAEGPTSVNDQPAGTGRLSAHEIQAICDTNAHRLAVLLAGSRLPARHTEPGSVVDTGRVLIHFTPTDVDVSFVDQHDPKTRVHMLIPGPWTFGALRLLVTGLHRQLAVGNHAWEAAPHG